MAGKATAAFGGDKAFVGAPLATLLAACDLALCNNMSASGQPVRVFMARRNLENIPEHSFPAGYSVRWYEPGDEEHWLRVHLAADRDHEISLAVFRRYFGSDEKLLRERQCYLLAPDANEIGTATAWFDDNFEGARWGRVHWVAIVPQYQGRGLARPLMTVICRRLRELGHDRAYLTTATTRRPAIKLYQQFGFVPLIRDEAEAKLWRGISG
jgi:GNAT superfamily N-acetyltransferase